MRAMLPVGLCCILMVAYAPVAAEESTHWAFQPIQNIALPTPPDPDGWIRDRIDAFVLQRLQEEGIQPSPVSDRER